MYPEKKAIFLWQLPRVADGTPAGIASAAQTLGVNIVSMKLGSGVFVYPYNLEPRPYIDALRAAGILVYGWHYVYSANNPAAEAQIAIQQIDKYDLDGYCLDAESHYKFDPPRFVERSERAEILASTIHDHCQSKGIALGVTSYRIPSYHRELPWQAFLENVDYVEPQVYWQPRTGPVVDLHRTIDEYLALYNTIGISPLPIFPAGRAYIGDGYGIEDGNGFPGSPPEEITAFLTECEHGTYRQEDGAQIDGCNFWSFDALYGHPGGAERFDAIAAYEWGEITPPPPTPGDLEERVDVLEGQMETVIELSANQQLILEGHGSTLAEHETRITDLENAQDGDIPSGTRTVRALERFPLGVVVGHDAKCPGEEPPGKPTVQHPPVEDRIIINVGDEFEVFASGYYSCRDDPSTPTIFAQSRNEHYLVVNGYDDEDFTFADSTKVELLD